MKPQTKEVFNPTPVPSRKICTHGRIIDEVLSREGKKSGQVRCLECGVIFPDPSHKVHASAVGELCIEY